MKRIISLLFILSIINLESIAQNLENTLLWKISGKDLSQSSYLFGTIHMICPEDVVMKEYFAARLAETDQVVLELDMDEPSLMTDMQKYGTNEGMKNISSEMTEEQQKVVNDFLQKYYSVGLQQLGIMKPITLTSMVMLKFMDCPQPQAYEAIFMQMAKKDSIEVLGLETVEFQFSRFDQIPLQKQIAILVETISDSTKSKEDFEQLVSAYQNQNLNAMYQLSKESPQYADFEETLINERNKNWIAPMEAFMQQKSTFFAVGALHLSGEQGVINLLREGGYTVEPVLQ
ncbi:MAG: TraB/GumN family protein [Cyclobacteriaceae bacterium]